MLKKILILSFILLFIQGCIEDPISDPNPKIPDIPDEPTDPLIGDPNIPQEPDNPPSKPYNPPIINPPFDPPDKPKPPIEPDEPEKECRTLLGEENVNLGCEQYINNKLTSTYKDGCNNNKPIQYQCRNNECIKQETEKCEECSKCTYKDERMHPNMAPIRTYSCELNEFSLPPGPPVCDCDEGLLGIIDYQPSYDLLVYLHCDNNWENVCNYWKTEEKEKCDIIQYPDLTCGGTNCECEYFPQVHVVCKINSYPTIPEPPQFSCNDCPDNFERYCIDPDVEDEALCDFCMENC